MANDTITYMPTTNPFLADLFSSEDGLFGLAGDVIDINTGKKTNYLGLKAPKKEGTSKTKNAEPSVIDRMFASDTSAGRAEYPNGTPSQNFKI